MEDRLRCNNCLAYCSRDSYKQHECPPWLSKTVRQKRELEPQEVPDSKIKNQLLTNKEGLNMDRKRMPYDTLGEWDLGIAAMVIVLGIVILVGTIIIF